MSRSYRCFCILCYLTAAVVAATMALVADRPDTADASVKQPPSIVRLITNG